MKFTGERLIPKLNYGMCFYYEHLVRYLFACQFCKNKVVVDAGCGTGYGSRIISKLGSAKKVFGIDISQEAIDYARTTYSGRKIFFMQGNLHNDLTRYTGLDVIICFEVIEHITDPKSFLKLVISSLVKNGQFIVCSPNKHNYPKGNPYHINEMYPKEFRRLLKSYFKHVYFFYQHFEFSQVIKSEVNQRFQYLDNYQRFDCQLITEMPSIKNSQYITAVCSNKPINLEKIKPVALNSYKVDKYNMIKGILSLDKQFNTKNTSDIDLIAKLKHNKKQLEENLTKIQSSKFYRLWQTYCRVRDYFTK